MKKKSANKKKAECLTRQARQSAKKSPSRFRDIWSTLSEKKRSALFLSAGQNELQTSFFNSADWSAVPNHLKSDLADAYHGKSAPPIVKKHLFIVPDFIRQDCDRIKQQKINRKHAVENEKIDNEIRQGLRDQMANHFPPTNASLTYTAMSISGVKEVFVKEQARGAGTADIYIQCEHNAYDIEVINKVQNAINNNRPKTESIKVFLLTDAENLHAIASAFSQIQQQTQERQFMNALESLLAAPRLSDYSPGDLLKAFEGLKFVTSTLSDLIQPLLSTLQKIVERHQATAL